MSQGSIELKKRIDVAVGVIRQGENVLVGQRLVQDRYFRKWEFPGGKLDANEDPFSALKRELSEELNVIVLAARPLITLEHDYPDRHVRLFVYVVNDFAGEPVGAEGQSLKWVKPSECFDLDFLDANLPITNAVQLPEQMFITDIQRYGFKKTLSVVEKFCREEEPSFALQLREDFDSRMKLEECLRALREVMGKRAIFLNGDPQVAFDLGFDGVQLNRHRAKKVMGRSELPDFWVGVSCHGQSELSHAEKVADFALLSPVQRTSSHPDELGMGWSRFGVLVRQAKLPCYALGGVVTEDIETAWSFGAQGIAAISSVWSISD
ncbi:MAG: Nudix family hydrolase [Arenicella sp.]